jgi:hypothetical protein
MRSFYYFKKFRIRINAIKFIGPFQQLSAVIAWTTA